LPRRAPLGVMDALAADRERLAAAIKPRDAWWSRLVVGPLANRVVGRLAPYPAVTPNRVTLFSLAVGLAAAALFFVAEQPALLAGALLLQVSFLLDCVDGQLARFRGSSSLFGAILDRLCDRVKLAAVLLGIATGAHGEGGSATPLVLAFFYFFCEYMIEVYVSTHRRFEVGAAPRGGEASRAVETALFCLRALDLPIVRLGFADRYFLMSAFLAFGAVAPLLSLLALLGALQLLLRPAYSVLALRARLGDWPWNDERRHHLGENF
ncbi:MAG: CDP-alcohol phosphatidyltransferase family protein, partial [Candidatus Binatia bacterium]